MSFVWGDQTSDQHVSQDIIDPFVDDAGCSTLGDAGCCRCNHIAKVVVGAGRTLNPSTFRLVRARTTTCC